MKPLVFFYRDAYLGHIQFFILLILCFIQTNISFSQLPYFTQYSENQLNINPALAGNFDGDTKLDAIFRSQSYNKIETTNFINTSLEFKPLKQYIPEEDVLGIGINMYSTKSLSVYSQNSFSGTVSYSKGLNNDGSEAIAVGLQCRYNSKRVDYTQLLFPSQFSLIGYTNQLPNNEPINVINSNYLDLNAGILYTKSTDDESFETGLGLFNLNQVSKDEQTQRLKYGTTYMAHIGYSRYIDLSQQFFIGGLYSYLNSGNAVSLIAAYSLAPDITNFVGLDFGVVYQINNSVSPYIKLNSNSFKFLFSYDLPINPNITYLQNATSFEVGIQCALSKVSESILNAKKHMSCFR